MRISEMISELQRIHSIMGDLDVAVECRDRDGYNIGGYDCDVDMSVYEKEAIDPKELQGDFELTGTDKILVID